MSVLVTCDSGGWRTPTRLKSRLQDEGLMLSATCSHHEPDHAAYLASRRIARYARADLICNEFRGDLVDVGRSRHHRRLFRSEIRSLSQTTRQAILEEIYNPYRIRVRRHLSALLLSKPYVVHVSVRTFEAKTDDGDWQRGDVGLLYDPSRDEEVDWCIDLADALYYGEPSLKVRRNHPWRGTNDSLTKSMRNHFRTMKYIGVEMVLNRAWAARSLTRRDEVLRDLGTAIARLTFDNTQQKAA